MACVLERRSRSSLFFIPVSEWSFDVNVYVLREPRSCGNPAKLNTTLYKRDNNSRVNCDVRNVYTAIIHSAHARARKPS